MAPVSSRSFCRRLSDCIVMGPANSHQRQKHQQQCHQQQSSATKLGRQVEEMEKELQKQKELKTMYKMRLERTQVYLRHCLQTAQEHGFMDLIVNNNKDNSSKHQLDASLSTSPSLLDTSLSSTRTPSPPQLCHPHLALLIDQAKVNGWYIEPHEIELRELADQGSTADIHKGRWRGQDVAVKRIHPDFFESNEDGVSFFAQEVENLSRQRSPFTLQLIGACLNPPHHAWIVTEFLGTTLKNWLHGQGKRQKERTIPLPPFDDRLQKALEIAQAMQYLHESKPRVLHRDLKPSNIFLDDAFHVRIADFGHARVLSDGQKALTGETGTYVYMAPEVIRCGPYDEKCDVYSFGVILNELITGEYPYIDTDYGPSGIAMEVAQNNLRPEIPKADHQTVELIELVQKSWAEDPATRPSFAEITCNLRKIIDKQRL